MPFSPAISAAERNMVEPSNLTRWPYDAADLKREEHKRWYSPASFFYSQGRALVLSSGYFADERLVERSRGGVARKHRHRIHLALFGQLMASLEYLFKDFIAQVVDLVPLYDDQIQKAEWISVDARHILSARTTRASPGGMLLHPTMGWQTADSVNQRYKNLFKFEPVAADEVKTLDQLWVLRHSVAHNAGLVTSHDAARSDMPHLSGEVASIDDAFLKDAFEFLCIIASRLAEKVGDRVVQQWLKSKRSSGKDYKRDKLLYTYLRWIATYVGSRSKDLPKVGKGLYSEDWNRANG